MFRPQRKALLISLLKNIDLAPIENTVDLIDYYATQISMVSIWSINILETNMLDRGHLVM